MKLENPTRAHEGNVAGGTSLERDPTRRSDRGERLALVTGATGFTGRHLSQALLIRGYRVRALVRDATKAVPLTRAGAEVFVGDLTRARDVDAAVQGCSDIYHLGGLFRPAKYPDRVYRDINVVGTCHILDAAARRGAERVVHCSTVGVHGHLDRVPADEEAPFNPGDIYQQTKLEGEMRAHEALRGGLTGAIVRPVGIYGPGDLRFLKLFRAIHNGIFFMFGSGEVVYHMTYIDDLVAGLILCGEHPRAVGETFILAGPRYTTINELVARVAVEVGRKPPRARLPLKPLLMAASICEDICRPLGIEPPLHLRRCDFFHKSRGFSIAKAASLLGYAPKIDLQEGLRRTAAWYAALGYLGRP